jgi:hypothetical protein
VSEFSESQVENKKNVPYYRYRTIEHNNILTHIYERAVDLRFLSNNEDIISLELVGGDFFDLLPLTTMKNLEQLILYKVSTIEDISPLCLIDLRKLEIVSCDNIKSYAPVGYLTGLKRLRIAGYSKNSFDAAHLSGLSNLEELEVSIINNILMNTQALGELINLRKLTIGHQKDMDLTWVVNLTLLESLSLKECEVEDVRPLLRLPKLTFVSFDITTVKDIMPLLESKTIKTIYEPIYELNLSYNENDPEYLEKNRRRMCSYREKVRTLFRDHGISLYDPHDR